MNLGPHISTLFLATLDSHIISTFFFLLCSFFDFNIQYLFKDR